MPAIAKSKRKRTQEEVVSVEDTESEDIHSDIHSDKWVSECKLYNLNIYFTFFISVEDSLEATSDVVMTSDSVLPCVTPVACEDAATEKLSMYFDLNLFF